MTSHKISSRVEWKSQLFRVIARSLNPMNNPTSRVSPSLVHLGLFLRQLRLDIDGALFSGEIISRPVRILLSFVSYRSRFISIGPMERPSAPDGIRKETRDCDHQPDFIKPIRPYLSVKLNERKSRASGGGALSDVSALPSYLWNVFAAKCEVCRVLNLSEDTFICPGSKKTRSQQSKARRAIIVLMVSPMAEILNSHRQPQARRAGGEGRPRQIKSKCAAESGSPGLSPLSVVFALMSKTRD